MMVKFVCVALFVGAHCGSAFVPTASNAMSSRHPSAALNMIENDGENDGIKSTVAAVALAASSDTAEAKPVDLTSETMQDTAHTRAYLDSARF